MRLMLEVVQVAPVRERGLKSDISRKPTKAQKVAPVRERGLKCYQIRRDLKINKGRSREGAWIEMLSNQKGIKNK